MNCGNTPCINDFVILMERFFSYLSKLISLCSSFLFSLFYFISYLF